MTDPFALGMAEDLIGDLRAKHDALAEVHQLSNVTDVPIVVPGAAQLFASGGQVEYVSSDGNAYNTGRLTIGATGSLTLGTSFATVNGLTVALALGSCHFRGQILVNPGVSGGTLSYQCSASGGLVASNFRVAFEEKDGPAGGTGGELNLADWSGALGSPLASGRAIGAGLANHIATYDGWIVVSTAGSMSIQVKLSSGAATTMQYGTYLEVFPVT